MPDVLALSRYATRTSDILGGLFQVDAKSPKPSSEISGAAKLDACPANLINSTNHS